MQAHSVTRIGGSGGELGSDDQPAAIERRGGAESHGCRSRLVEESQRELTVLAIGDAADVDATARRALFQESEPRRDVPVAESEIELAAFRAILVNTIERAAFRPAEKPIGGGEARLLR